MRAIVYCRTEINFYKELARVRILTLGLKEFLSPFQMLLEEKADALREEAEEMTTAPELATTERTEN